MKGEITQSKRRNLPLEPHLRAFKGNLLKARKFFGWAYCRLLKFQESIVKETTEKGILDKQLAISATRFNFSDKIQLRH